MEDINPTAAWPYWGKMKHTYEPDGYVRVTINLHEKGGSCNCTGNGGDCRWQEYRFLFADSGEALALLSTVEIDPKTGYDHERLREFVERYAFPRYLRYVG